MWDNDNIFIRDYNTDVKHSHSSPRLGHEQFSQDRSPRPVRSTVLDPFQDLVVVVPFPGICVVAGAGQNRHIFSVEFRLASSLAPHPDSMDAFFKCQHFFEQSGHYRVTLMQEPVICGDRIVVLYYTSDAVGFNLFIQVIGWRKGQAQSYPLREDVAGFHLVDEQKFAVIDTQGLITFYTLQEHGSLRRRAMYRLLESVRAPFYQFHATPSFHGATTCPDLEPGYVPSLESQIIVLETLTNAWPVILVIDVVIFSGKALHSETPIEIPWSEWGPQYTCCFQHNSSCQISVFGSKIAYALPRYAIPRALPWISSPKDSVLTLVSTCTSWTSISESSLARKIFTTLTYQLALYASHLIITMDPLSRIVLTLPPSVVLNFHLTALQGYSWNTIDLL